MYYIMATKWSRQISEKIGQKDQKTCRICSDDTCSYGDKWIRPCHCKGSVEWVHLLCLKQWFTHSNKMSCEICTCPYKLVYAPNKNQSNAFLDYVNPRIAPMIFTIFFMIAVFDVSYWLTAWRSGGIGELYQFGKLFTFGMIAVFFLLEIYCWMIDVTTNLFSELIYVDVSYGYAILFFMLPSYLYEQFRIMMNTGENGIRNEIEHIVDIVNA